MIKQVIYDEVQGLSPVCQRISRQLWKNPEVGGMEKKSADYLRGVFRRAGFTIVDGKSLPHSFYAEYGSGAPLIAVLGEYDALPGLSQQPVPEKAPVTEGGPGHGCGHNLIGAASATATLAIRRYLEKSGMSGTVRFYGCPQEELLDGKVRMIAEGMFDNCDVALSWHPMDANMVHDRAYLANTGMKFFFSGRTSHAAFAPERGRSALDAVELMSVGCNYLREHVVDRTRIHYTTNSGGFAPNIVPDQASAWYFIRAPHISDVLDTTRRVELVARGAAMMTETEVRVEHGCACCEFKENNTFGDLTYANLIEADGPKYTQEELDFAATLQATVDSNVVLKGQRLYDRSGDAAFTGVGGRNLWRSCEMTASSDTGDVSFLIPTGLFTAACWPIGCAPHTWQATAAGGMSIGEKGALYAAKVLAGTAYDLLHKPELLVKIQQEFNDRDTGDYRPMVGDC